MGRHYFLDTNVVMDFLTMRPGFYEDARRLFLAAENGEIRLYVSALSFSNIFYVLRKYYSREERLQNLKLLARLVEIVPVTSQNIHRALDSGMKDFEDAIQMYGAVGCDKVDALVTRNGKDFDPVVIAIMTPEEAVNSLH